MKISRATKVLASAALATILLTGCGGGAPAADGGTYKTATELKDAFVKAGGKCDDWEPHNKTILAATSGACGRDFALSVFDNTEKYDLQVSTFRKVGGASVVGKNWVFSGVNAASAQKLLGGELITKK